MNEPGPVGLTGASFRSVARAVTRRPDLWGAAIGALRRLAVPGWWRTTPYLPVPDRRLWGFRMVTAYGHEDAEPVAEDVVSYLEWCRSTSGRHRLAGPRSVRDGRHSPLHHRQSG